MNSESSAAVDTEHGLVEYTHWIYGLYALSVLMALAGAHSVALREGRALPVPR